MSFLYPLFLAGIAAVGLPIILHMVRRHTRKRVTFSSLMFLRTALPRFKNRSHLEDLPLLILRCILLCLLAFAFSRPFFPRETAADQIHLGRRIVVLIDTSASMRRAGMWDRAISEAQAVLKAVSRTDQVCVMSFDRRIQTLVGFEEWWALDAAQRASIVAEYISELSPGWARTNLGHALVAAAEAIEDDEVNDGQLPLAVRQVVLISDLQAGSNLEALHAYEWPEGMELVIKPIRCQGTTNAALHLVANRDHLARPGSDDLPNIRITNSADAIAEKFQLSWADEIPPGASGRATGVYVPAGHSIVVRVPSRANGSAGQKLVLTGDDHDFDNTLHMAPCLKEQVNILYVGSDDANDSDGMLYYVQRAFVATRSLNPHIISRPADRLTDTDIATAHLIIATDTIEQEHFVWLRRSLESGGAILLVMKSPDAATTLAGLAGLESIESQEADVDKYAMLSQIDFEHPLLVPFSEPRFGDFTRIHFWKHRRINLADVPGARVLAWLDSNAPALFELHVGEGSLLVLTSGWHPSDSQLALSSKFVPLLYSILEYTGVLAGQQSQYFVGDHVPIPHSLRSSSANVQIRKPDDSVVSLEAGQRTFTQTELPGVYAIESSAGNQLFAVNLPVAECKTAAMPIEELERFGVPLRDASSVAVERTQQTKRRSDFAGLEYEQKVWRWVLIALLAVSLIEIWLAGWLTRRPSMSQGEQI